MHFTYGQVHNFLCIYHRKLELYTAGLFLALWVSISVFNLKQGATGNQLRDCSMKCENLRRKKKIHAAFWMSCQGQMVGRDKALPCCATSSTNHDDGQESFVIDISSLKGLRRKNIKRTSQLMLSLRSSSDHGLFWFHMTLEWIRLRFVWWMEMPSN